MSKILQRHNFYFNTKHATRTVNGTAFCEFELDKKITLSDPHAYFEVTINRANIPFSFLQFSPERNNVTLEYFIPSLALSGSIIISQGNYIITQMMQELKVLIEQEILNVAGINVLVTFEYNTILNRLRAKMISLSSPVIIQFSSGKLSTALGFTSFWELNTITGDWVYGNIDVEMNPICCLYLTSTDLVQNTTEQSLGQPLQSGNIISVIPLVHPPYYYAIHDPNNPIVTRILNSTISKIDMNIITMGGDPLSNFFLPYTIEMTILERIDPDDITRSPQNGDVMPQINTQAEDMRNRGFINQADQLLSEQNYNSTVNDELENLKQQQLSEVENIKQTLKRKRIE